MTNNLLMMIVAGTAMMALSGCTAVDGLTAEAELTYDGSSNGDHSDRADCDAKGELSGAGDIHDGGVHVTVEDSDGTILFSQTFDGSFTLADTTLDGDSGAWTLHAIRGGDDVVGDEFGGEYQFYLDCAGI